MSMSNKESDIELEKTDPRDSGWLEEKINKSKLIDLPETPLGSNEYFQRNERKNKHTTWVDIMIAASPDRFKDKMKEIEKMYHLKNMRNAIKNCLSAALLPKLEKYDDNMFIITRYFDEEAKDSADSIGDLTNKIAFFVTKDTVITVHRTDIPFLKDLRDNWEQSYIEYDKEHLINRMIDQIIKGFAKALEKSDEVIDNYELKIFSNQRDIIASLYHIKRRASVIKRMLKLTKDICTHYARDTKDQLFSSHLVDFCESQMYVANEIHENSVNMMNLYVTLASHRTNELMTVLTTFSIFFIPLTFIAGIYGMNFDYMPELRLKGAYFVCLGVMVVITIGIALWFSSKGLLPKPYQSTNRRKCRPSCLK